MLLWRHHEDARRVGRWEAARVGKGFICGSELRPARLGSDSCDCEVGAVGFTKGRRAVMSSLAACWELVTRQCCVSRLP